MVVFKIQLGEVWENILGILFNLKYIITKQAMTKGLNDYDKN